MTLLDQIRAILAQRGGVAGPNDVVVQDDGTGPYIARWNSDRVGARPTAAELAGGTEATVTAAAALALDQQADAAFDPTKPGFQLEHVRPLVAAMLKVTHQRLAAVAQAAGVSAGTVGTFAAFVGDVKTDFRTRLH